MGISSAVRLEWGARISAELNGFLCSGHVLALSCRVRSAPADRDCDRRRASGGVARGHHRGAPLEYRAWRPGENLVSEIWDIPIPAKRKIVKPVMVLAPLGGQP